MATINLTVYGHEITCTNEEKPVLSQGSHNIDTVIFSYDSTYSGYTLYATMYQSMSDPVLVELSNNSCKIPIDALLYPGKVRIGLRAEDSQGSVIATSCLEWFNVEPGAIDGSEGTSTSGIASLANRIAALESQTPPDATTAAAGQAPIADGAGGWEWGDVQGGGSGLTEEVKSALLACFRGVVWKDDVDPEALYGALDTALNPPADLARISAVYSGGTVDVNASLESLRNNLTVTAHYTDSTSETVTTYTLSGNIAEVGEQTVTVVYGGKNTTFTVTVTSDWEYVWDFTKSLTDKVSGRVAVASAGTGVDAPAITKDGLAFTAATQRVSLCDIDLTGKIIEIDVASMNFVGDTGSHIRFLTSGMATTTAGAGPIVYRSGEGWRGYGMNGNSATWGPVWMAAPDRTNKNYFSGKTLRLVNNLDNSRELYVDGDLIGTMTGLSYANQKTTDVAIGGCTSYSQSQGDQCYDMVISAVRIKDVEVE